ncbi:hypothetical protein JKP88DRAFT_266861 [Tribonema minus]|uniref:Uncharacterized protein n=1 Tax=Tribonema minus TaxID=303371 RepID=A0A835ZDY5_9STRA|nr:hypothetical protein JKP88DRAFT_266861 [Tribonema minus]
MPRLVELDLSGDFTKAGELCLPEQLEILKLRDFAGSCELPSAVEELELSGSMASTAGFPRNADGTSSWSSGRPNVGHGVLVPLSPELTYCVLNTDLDVDGALALPTQLEELHIGEDVTKRFALPLPPSVYYVNMHAQHQDDTDAVALWRKELVENLPAGVEELLLVRALTCAAGITYSDEAQEPDDIAWPATIQHVILVDWAAKMIMPPRMTSLSLQDAEPFVLSELLSLPDTLESLFISGSSDTDLAQDWEQVNEHEWCSAPARHAQAADVGRIHCGTGSNRSGVHLMLKNGLPPKLEEFVVVWYSDFNAALTQFPPTLRVSRLNKSFDAPLEDIPAGLQEAILPECKRQSLVPAIARVSYI